MQATLTTAPAVAEPRRITWAFEFEHDLEIFASDRCLPKCPSCALGTCALDHGHAGTAHSCNYCGTEF
ncbi:MAG: hypothetical protein ABW277_22830 [Longimicrobiaceae bacterium]